MAGQKQKSTIAEKLSACRAKIKAQEKEIAKLRKENEFLSEATRFLRKAGRSGGGSAVCVRA